MILPLQWITIIDMSDHILKSYNLFLCQLLYFPLSITFTVYFTLINTLLMPLAYVFHVIKLIQSIPEGNEENPESV
jgi:hypothetical protein